MDLIKIGSFIKSCRKNKSLTQEDLAEKLNISFKTVSKWECGKGLPDVSIMLELCNLLEISVNELLNGEHIDSKNYMEKADKKLLEIQEEKVRSDKRLLNAEIYVITLSTLIFLVCTYFFVVLLEKGFNLYGWILFAIGLLIFIPSTIFCLLIEQKVGYYKCPSCGHFFVPKFKHVLWAAHLGRTRKLKCPNCGKKSYCKKVLK